MSNKNIPWPDWTTFLEKYTSGEIEKGSIYSRVELGPFGGMQIGYKDAERKVFEQPLKAVVSHMFAEMLAYDPHCLWVEDVLTELNLLRMELRQQMIFARWDAEDAAA
jgi:hypothetical protein